MMQCSVDEDAFTLTVTITATKIVSLVVMVGICGLLTMWVKIRQQSRADGKPPPVGRHLDDFLPEDVDDLIDTIVPHLLVHQRLYRRHRKVYGDGFEQCCTYVDVIIGKVSAALGPVCEAIRNADEDTEPMTTEEIGNLLAHEYMETSDDNIVDEWYRHHRRRTRMSSEDNSGEGDGDNDDLSAFSESNLTPLSQGSDATVYRPMPTV